MRLFARNHIFVCLPFAAMLAVGGCSNDVEPQPITQSQAALSAETNLKDISQNLAASAGFLAESDAIAEVLAPLQSCDSEVATPACDPAIEIGCPVGAPVVPPESECGTQAVKQDLRELNKNFDEAISKLITRLKDEVFLEQNVESRTATEIIYRLPSSFLCDMMGDEDCLSDYEKSQPRLQVTSPAKGDLDVGVLVSAKRLKPVVFQIYRERLGMSYDLSVIHQAMLEVSPETAEEIVKMTGAMSVSLVKNGDRDFSFLASIDRDVDLTLTDEGIKEMHMDASSKVYEVRLDGKAKTITAALNFGAFSAKLPLESLGDLGGGTTKGNALAISDVADFVLGGLSGSITFNGNSDSLVFKGLGLGNRSTSFSVNGKEVVGLDINKNQGRRFQLTVTGAEGESPLFTFDPGLEVELRLKFKVILDKFKDIPTSLWDDTLTFKLSGTKPSLRGVGDSLQVVSGTLFMGSAAEARSNVTVNAGMCLVNAEESTSTSQEEAPLLSSWKSGACQ